VQNLTIRIKSTGSNCASTRQSSTCTPACASKQGQPEQNSPQERTQASQGKQAEAKAEAANGKKPAQLPACPTFKQKSKFDSLFEKPSIEEHLPKSFQSDLVPRHSSPSTPSTNLKVKTST
jgi:hypothetical protein